ncbi:MAG: hypothetical protein AB3N16_07555 [Flavobacteriaceae bacterium]
MVPVLGILMASCGSYQSASYYDSDGIYADPQDRRTVERAPQKKQVRNTYSDSFGQKDNELDELREDEVFTDIDSYSSAGTYDSIPDSGELTQYYKNENDYNGYAGWGDNTSNVYVNVYGNNWGWNNWGWGWNDPWLWNNWGWGYNTWRWYGRPWRYGWGWGWNNPWGWNNWGWGGYGRANKWCPPYGYYNSYSYGYNRGRRGYYNNNSLNTNSRYALRGRSNVTTRGSSPRYRSTAATRSSRSVASRTPSRYRNGNLASRRSVGVDQNRAYRTSRSTRAVPRYNSSSRSNQSYRSSAPGQSTYRRGTSSAPTRSYRSSRNAPSRSAYSRTSRSNQSYRSSAPSRSSYRSSGSRSYSPSRGSRSYSAPARSSYRSSGGSSRSSGSFSRSSSGRSSAGRSGGRRQ